MNRNEQKFHKRWFCVCGWNGSSIEMDYTADGGSLCPKCGAKNMIWDELELRQMGVISKLIRKWGSWWLR